MWTFISRGPATTCLSVVVATAFLLAAGPRSARADAIIDVDQSLLAAIRTAASSPPVASRDIAMVGIAMYDAVNATTGLTYQPYSYTGPAISGDSPDAAAYAAGYTMLEDLFPGLASSFQAAETTSVAALALNAAVQNSSTSFGASVTANLFSARANDGSATAQTPYTPGNQPGNYQFTKAGQSTIVEPGWGNVTPFAITSVASVAPPPLWGPGTPYATEAAYLASPFYQNQLATVEAEGCSTCGQTPDQLAQAAFWADTNGNASFGSTETPPGHWLDITDTVAENAGLSLLQTARLGAMVGASLADAGIAAWATKNEVNFWRPDTAIAASGVTGWTPLWPDPLFQSYISGHSTFSMAAAGTLADFFGTDNVSFCSNADPNAHTASSTGSPAGQPLSSSGTGITYPYTTTETDPNGNQYTVTVMSPTERCYTSFTDAAYEAGESRVIGGIHFPIDNVEGLATGAAVAQEVVSNDFTEVPEPNGIALLAVAAIGLGAVRARRRTAV